MSVKSHQDLIAEVGSDPDAPVVMSLQSEVTRPFLVFRLGPSWYAFQVEGIQEVLPYSVPTPVPGLPAMVAGVANLSGKIAVVMDLRQLPGMSCGPSTETDAQWRKIVLRVDGLPVAIIAEEVAGLSEVPVSQLQPPSEGARLPLRERFFLEEKVVTVLDLTELLMNAEAELSGEDATRGFSHR